MLMSGTKSITPQGYTYAIEPNTEHPFWKETDPTGTGYKYTELKTPVLFENTDTNFTTFYLSQEDPVFFAVLTLSLVKVTINTEVALPFVGLQHGDVAFLICEGSATNTLKAVGVYSNTDFSSLEISNVESTPAPIKGDKGDNGTNGKDGVTPVITATAEVSNTTGVPSVNVTKAGTDTAPIFDFSFMNVKGETGEKGDNGTDGTNGTDGVTPDITVIATVDETTGTPAVNVKKSGTTEKPVFDLEFTGLKGESGGSTVSKWKTKQDTPENIATFIQNSNINDFVVYGTSELNDATKNNLSAQSFVVYDMISGAFLSRGQLDNPVNFPAINFCAQVENNIVTSISAEYDNNSYGNGSYSGGENFVFDTFTPRTLNLYDFSISAKANNICFYSNYTTSGYVAHIIGNPFTLYYVYVPIGNITIMYKE